MWWFLICDDIHAIVRRVFTWLRYGFCSGKTSRLNIRYVTNTNTMKFIRVTNLQHHQTISSRWYLGWRVRSMFLRSHWWKDSRKRVLLRTGMLWMRVWILTCLMEWQSRFDSVWAGTYSKCISVVRHSHQKIYRKIYFDDGPDHLFRHLKDVILLVAIVQGAALLWNYFWLALLLVSEYGWNSQLKTVEAVIAQNWQKAKKCREDWFPFDGT